MNNPTTTTQQPGRSRSAFAGVYAGKRVLVTGHTGFKGSWLCEWLLSLGADVTGFALAPVFWHARMPRDIGAELSGFRGAQPRGSGKGGV